MAHVSDPRQECPVDPSGLEDAEAAFSSFFAGAFRRVYRFTHARLADPRAVERVTADVLRRIVEERADLLPPPRLSELLLTRLSSRIRDEKAQHDDRAACPHDARESSGSEPARAR
jgi:hypothetical protein